MCVTVQPLTGLFTIRIDHLIYNDYASNLLLFDLVIYFDDELCLNSAARHSDQSNSPDCFTHAMVNVCSFGIPRSVFQAYTIIVSCGLANFEQSSWSTHPRHEFWVSCEELYTKEDCDKFVRSFEDKYRGKCDGRSISMIDCRKFDDLGNDKSLREHIGRNPKIVKSILESENDHPLHGRPFDGMYRFSLSKNIVIMICRSARHRSVANAELWSNALALCRRHQHSVSLLHLSELDSWANTCCRKMFGMHQTVRQNFADTTTVSKLSVHDMLPCPIL